MNSLFFLLDWTLPVVECDLTWSRYGQFACGCIFGQCRACTERSASTDANRCDQLRGAADEHVVFDFGAEFICAIVITGNRTGTDIDPLTNGRVADIGQMVGLAIVTDLAIFDLNKIADVGTFLRIGIHAQTGEGSDESVGPNG